MNLGQYPDHVPAELVRDYDIYYAPQAKDHWQELADVQRNNPDIFWNIKGDPLVTPNGTWVITREALFREVLQNPEAFSSRDMTGYAKSIGEDWPLIPLEIDAPDHMKYRLILNSEFSPKTVTGIEGRVRALAIELIERIAPAGRCEFNRSFATLLPITIFLELMGLSIDQLEDWNRWSATLNGSVDLAERQEAATSIRRELGKIMADREANPERNDIAGKVVRARIDGRPLTEQEKIGILFLLLIGGTDTVTATLGNIFKHLAENPDTRRRLRELKGAALAPAVEELLRRFSVVLGKRCVVRDVNFHNVQMKQGDWITLIYPLAGLDPQAYRCPMDLDLQRSPNLHMTFAYGPHRCLGSNLARAEIRIALEEWLKRIPDFALVPGSQLVSKCGVYGWKELPLIWETRATSG